MRDLFEVIRGIPPPREAKAFTRNRPALTLYRAIAGVRTARQLEICTEPVTKKNKELMARLATSEMIGQGTGDAEIPPTAAIGSRWLGVPLRAILPAQS